MVEATVYTFTHKELVALLVKAAGIHEGKWMMFMQFGMGAGNFAASPSDLNPGAALVVQKVGIQKPPDGMPPENNLTVDAGEVNPAPA